MGFKLRATIPPRRAAVILVVVTAVLAASMSWGIALASANSQGFEPIPSTSARPGRTGTTGTTTQARAPRRARVLLIGDSVLDQQGSAASFLLRQAGVDAKAVGLWGSGLLTVDQYDYGKTKFTSGWLLKAKTLVAGFDPDVVGVYLNHNYWPPFPHDAAGHEITDLWSVEGQSMIGQQARALITILRSRHARVFFISPIPAGTISNPDPNAWSAIWHGYLPVLQEMHVSIADTARSIEDAAGLRTETQPSCHGAAERVRPAGDLHMTRFGAGRAGTALADFVAPLVHANLRDNTAPAEDTAALVATRDGRGYWLVGCDGSVYHFGTATPLAGAPQVMAQHSGVAAAVASPTGAGMWLIASDGTIAAIGDAPPLAFATHPAAPIVSATAVPGRFGLLAATASGMVLATGDATTHGDLGSGPSHAPIVAIASTHTGLGYWLTGNNGDVFPFGDASLSPGKSSALDAPVVGFAATADDRGYWLVASDGSVSAFGDARFLGSGVWKTRPYPYSALFATPGPAVGVVATNTEQQGYWIFGTTGRVVPRGDAGAHHGDNNLALFTQ